MADMYLSRRATQRRWDGKTLRDDLAPGGDSFPADGAPLGCLASVRRCCGRAITRFWPCQSAHNRELLVGSSGCCCSACSSHWVLMRFIWFKQSSE